MVYPDYTEHVEYRTLRTLNQCNVNELFHNMIETIMVLFVSL